MLLKPGLYIVSTPIGNLEDITIRALETLKKSDIILCENRYVSLKLLNKYNIHNKLMSYNDHSDINVRAIIMKLISNGKVISLISDSGTPLISDPGYKLVELLINNNYLVDVIPGPTSPIAALTISGLPTNRWLFLGFIPKTNNKRVSFFSELVTINATLIFFESPYRLLDSLIAVHDIFGNRIVCVIREVTKIYQEVKRGKCNEIIDFYKKNLIKGEIVLMISGIPESIDKSTLNIESLLKNYLQQGYSKKSAVTLVSKQLKSCQKSYLYKLANSYKLSENDE